MYLFVGKVLTKSIYIYKYKGFDPPFVFYGYRIISIIDSTDYQIVPNDAPTAVENISHNAHNDFSPRSGFSALSKLCCCCVHIRACICLFVVTFILGFSGYLVVRNPKVLQLALAWAKEVLSTIWSLIF